MGEIGLDGPDGGSESDSLPGEIGPNPEMGIVLDFRLKLKVCFSCFGELIESRGMVLGT